MTTSEKTKRNDFVEIQYTGYANDKIFDSNIPEDLKSLDPKEKPRKIVVSIGQNMLVPGLDKALENKSPGTEYEVELSPKESFGERKQELIKTLPLKIFQEKNTTPRPGMVFALDNSLVKILAVSGARVITDFNNPLAGKNIKYKFKILRKVTDEKEKAAALFEALFKFLPEFEIKDKIIIKGPKSLEILVKTYAPKFKELLGRELILGEKKEN